MERIRLQNIDPVAAYIEKTKHRNALAYFTRYIKYEAIADRKVADTFDLACLRFVVAKKILNRF
ncbi:hypothetical protein FACS1894187_17210 [Synergistales bacterium]|nr:hypothetical protein FACS1894187_17210 [Synergistales bacterium]